MNRWKGSCTQPQGSRKRVEAYSEHAVCQPDPRVAYRPAAHLQRVGARCSACLTGGGPAGPMLAASQLQEAGNGWLVPAMSLRGNVQCQLPYVSPAGDGGQLGRGPQCELAHADQVLRDLGQALLVLVHQELGPVLEVLVHLQARHQSTSTAKASVLWQACSCCTRSISDARVWWACSWVLRTWASGAGAHPPAA